jgi:hypothetical protein
MFDFPSQPIDTTFERHTHVLAVGVWTIKGSAARDEVKLSYRK